MLQVLKGEVERGWTMLSWVVLLPLEVVRRGAAAATATAALFVLGILLCCGQVYYLVGGVKQRLCLCHGSGHSV